METDFLNCRCGHTPFKYLGLPVGANPRKLATWEPMLNAIRGKLSAWENKHVTLGGRIVLINAVLNAIPVFYLSYLKMPVKVWKEVVKIQRTFLWGGLSKRHRICWVKWDDICKPKKEARLGIRDPRLVNFSFWRSGDGNFYLRTWRDICNLDKDTNWFSEAVEKKVGDGTLTKFWTDMWIDNQTLP
ncbi:RNA-directed DNA polymerase (Reverse transcriptase), partial [Trifolium medium]|nr:RNA-directed DNA polymerase (Reverse transcriptase) [Trifolium medium]